VAQALVYWDCGSCYIAAGAGGPAVIIAEFSLCNRRRIFVDEHQGLPRMKRGFFCAAGVRMQMPSKETMMRICFVSLVGLVLFVSGTTAAQELPFRQHENIVFREAHGVGLLMDVFTPTASKNGLGIVDVISGAWHSDRGKIRDHARAQTFHILCRKGYTVFAIRPGSVSKFSVPEMLENLNEGIRWVKDHSKDYGIDPDRLGLMGASAGGHLACLAAVTAKGEKPSIWRFTQPTDTRVKAVAVFFPPADFLNWNGKPIDLQGDGRLAGVVRRLAFPDGLGSATAEEVAAKLTQISPARLVTAAAPPFLIFHGDADPIVPLQQSKVLLEALKKATVPAELTVKKGGGHPWLTLHEEVQLVAEWFDKQLDAERDSATE
jgi:acetyl esterase/lipase